MVTSATKAIPLNPRTRVRSPEYGTPQQALGRLDSVGGRNGLFFLPTTDIAERPDGHRSNKEWHHSVHAQQISPGKERQQRPCDHGPGNVAHTAPNPMNGQHHPTSVRESGGIVEAAASRCQMECEIATTAMPTSSSGYTGERPMTRQAHGGGPQARRQKRPPVPAQDVDKHAPGQGDQSGGQFRRADRIPPTPTLLRLNAC